jgi:hypothetical protein
MTMSKRKGPGMATSSDLWYVRLPDGRVLHARSTNALRRYLTKGRIPWDIRVRRSSDARWQTLDRTPEFADLLRTPEPEGPPAPPDMANTPIPDSRIIGVRGLVEELFSAIDASLQRTKLTTTAVTGLGMGITVLVGIFASPQLGDWAWAGSLAAAVVWLVLFSMCTSILTQMTSLELSRDRPVLFSEAHAGLFGFVLRLSCALGLIGGLMLGLIVLFRALPGWLAFVAPDEIGLGWEILRNVIIGMHWVLEVICWPILALAMLLMGPILIVEDCSIWQGLREWLHLLRQHLARIYLYQTIAFAFAAMMTLPLVLPIVLVGRTSVSLGEAVPFYLLLGLALTPGLAYLIVAQVFIYLNLRYEFFYSARER